MGINGLVPIRLAQLALDIVPVGTPRSVRAMARPDFPRSLAEFQDRFASEAAFQSLLGLSTRHAPTTYKMLCAAEPTG